MAKSDENLALHLIWSALAPIGAASLVLMVVGKLQPLTWTTFGVGVGVAVLVFIVVLVVALRWQLRGLKRYRDDLLGYLGEREVAEHLMPLLARGHRVFHDVPAKGAKSDFNLDHVAVGPSGVALIETKTRRKGRARPGMKDHVVTYDGNQLIWPWGEDRHGLEQAIAEANWLGKLIHERTGIDTPVKPILALPGWWVESKARGVVTVVNSKNVAAAVEGKGQRVLSDEQVDLVSRQLDVLCRDVTD
jgi:type III secretory pathway component EscS